jgi:hypothetical protein
LLCERCWIKLGGGLLPEIRAAAVGQAHVPEHVLRPLLLPAVHAPTVRAPLSANPLSAGSYRTIITGCSQLRLTPPVSRNICPANKKRCCPQQHQRILPARSIRNDSSCLRWASSSFPIRFALSARPRSSDLFHAPAALLVFCQQPFGVLQLPDAFPAVLPRAVPFPAHQIPGGAVASRVVIDDTLQLPMLAVLCFVC